MNIKMKQYVNEVYLENFKDMVYLDITCEGSFDIQMEADGYVWGNSNRIVVTHITMPQSGLLFTYTGDLRIVQVTMGDVYKQKHFVQNKRITDEVQAIESIWSLDTSRYEDYDQSNKGKHIGITKVKTKVGSKKTANINN